MGETAEELANYTIRLLKDPGSAQSLGDMARELVTAGFDFEKAIERLWSLVETRLVEPAPAVQV